MAGFLIKTCAGGLDNTAVQLVDAGDCDLIQERRFRHSLAGWARWSGSRQLHVFENRGGLIWIEGQPDRLLGPEEPLERWLEGRGGSFRGFRIERRPAGPEHITVFVDSLGTRPVFLFRTTDRIWLSDKPATIAVNSPGLECDWGALLECAVLRSTYSKATALRGVEMLAPGEIVEMSGASIIGRRASPVILDSPEGKVPNASKALESALRTAIRETWTASDSYLLLSGGLDSRLILGLSEGRRKTLTVDRKPHETAIARQVAAACNAELRVDPFPPEHYCGVMRNAYLITSAMHESKLTNHLGMATAWRKSGIRAIVHGYLHNMVFRGWTSERQFEARKVDSPVGKLMGPAAYYFDTMGVTSQAHQAAVIGLLSSDGRHFLKNQLAQLGSTIEPVIVDGFDLTFERWLISDVARQVYYGGFAGWLEEVDVESPVFHPAVWQWYATTHPRDRHRDAAVRQIYARIGRGLAEIPDSNNMRKVSTSAHDAREGRGNQFWYPAARRIWRSLSRVIKKPPKPATDWAAIFRQSEIVEIMSAGIAAVKQHPLLDRTALERAVAEYHRGDDSRHDALWAIATIGQWHEFVRTAGASNPAVRQLTSSTAASAPWTSSVIERR